MEKTVKNKVVLVTGGASGIGLSIVDIFLEHGAKLAIIVDINEELGTEAVKSMSSKYGSDKAVFLKCDVTVDLDETFDFVIKKYTYIDILVNNAGVGSENSIKTTININLISVMEWSVKFYDHMRQDRGGHGGTIVNMSSIYGLKATPFATLYHASKYGVIGFSKSLGHEYNFKKTGVRVVTLCPGFTYTKMTANMVIRDDDAVEDFLKEAKSDEWQEPAAVGKGAVEVVEKAESGTVWVVKRSNPAFMVEE